MSWWAWDPFTPRTYSQTTTNNTMSCTSWYGHSFEKFDGDTLFCPTCGQVRKVKR